MKSIALKDQVKSIFKGYGWILHLVYWSILLTYLVFQLRAAVSSNKYPYNYIFYSSISRVICLAALCYSYLLFIIPSYKQSQRSFFWLKFAGLIVFWDGLHILLARIIALAYPELDHNTAYNFWTLAQRQSYTFIILFAFFIAFYYFRDIYVRQKEIQELARYKTEKIALESSFLKSQINPHFLFNTLNNIYALSLKKSEQTPVIIERLESLLQYMLYDCKEDQVRLSDEFNFTNSYIALEKLRHRDEQCIVTVNIKGDVKDQKIAPLLLINFLENAFKHGTKATFGKSWIKMDVMTDQQSLKFNLQNSKPLQMPIRQNFSEYTGGIGLKNVKRRLEILYPGKHELIISDLKDRFDVNLTVNF